MVHTEKLHKYCIYINSYTSNHIRQRCHALCIENSLVDCTILRKLKVEDHARMLHVCNATNMRKALSYNTNYVYTQRFVWPISLAECNLTIVLASAPCDRKNRAKIVIAYFYIDYTSTLLLDFSKAT